MFLSLRASDGLMSCCGTLTALSPSKHAGSNPEAFWLRPVMAIMASVLSESGWIVYAGSNFPHSFQLHFSKEGMDHVQNRLDLIWMAWSGFHQTHQVWKQAGV